MLSRVWLRAQSHEPVVWLLTGLWIPAIYFLLWSFIGVGAVDESAWIQWPAKGSRHESREPRRSQRHRCWGEVEKARPVAMERETLCG